MEKQASGHWVQVTSGTFNEASMMQSILINEGIEAVLKDDFMGSIAPYLASPGGAGSVKVMVQEEHYQRALEVVEDVEKSRRL
ncbi:MAG: DUF2007 domain-containing protein [Bacteroidales bacterium]|jgi:hypothetical protein|nr:DUF2007 domain-containing protein [Bacteroidales bacterium]